MAMLHYFWRFAQICFSTKLFTNNNKNNFANKWSKILANLCKSSEILGQCHVKWLLDYRIYGSVSYSFSTEKLQIEYNKFFWMLKHKQKQFGVHNMYWTCMFLILNSWFNEQSVVILWVKDHPFKTSACLRGRGMSPFADSQKVTVHKDR